MILLSLRVRGRPRLNKRSRGALIASAMLRVVAGRRVLATMTDTSEYASTRLRAWAHSRALYVDYHARLDWVIETVTVRREAERLLARVRPGVALLWALALEIDECGATLTGERVCRACSGRQSIVATANGRYPSTAVIRYGDGRLGPWSQLRAVSVQPCSCDGPTRPDTVSLHWLVRHLASQRSPIVTDWPEQWVVDVDAMEANGWGDTWLPSQGEPPKPWLAGKWEPLAQPTWSRKHESRMQGNWRGCSMSGPQRGEPGKHPTNSSPCSTRCAAYSGTCSHMPEGGTTDIP
jgi:hypothetical protein